MAIDPKVLKQVRRALDLTQQELADALGLSRVTVNKMERGRLRRGIPDEVATRLMFLRASPKTYPAKPYGEKFQENVSWGVLDDSHLWDNEEDDQ